MKALAIPQTRVRLLMLALVLILFAALLIPQFAWADHASDDLLDQYEAAPSSEASAFYAALVEKYKSGDLVYHAPGR